MSHRSRTFIGLGAVAALAACSTENSVTSVNGKSASLDASAAPGLQVAFEHARVCPTAGPNAARCHSWVRVDPASGRPFAASAPSGYSPADLWSAYKLNTNGGSSQTIAIVDAFDDPNAESDLAVYRAQFGLPVCSTANGCFKKVNQSGGTKYPSGDVGWSEEISLDLDMASAICPNCKILLVEATSNSFNDLAAAVDWAASTSGGKANVISNSYGGTEFSSEVSYQSHFNHPGVAITVSSGDSGYGVEFPAASQYVTAVGGTSLSKSSDSRGWTESAWSGAGSGCSRYMPKPSWQHDSGCSNRTVADVSAVADPNTGVAVYDTYGVGGWLVFGGTSVSSPIIAAVYALAGNAGSVTYGSFPYSNTSSLFDVTSGINGHCHRIPYLCSALAGYDGPTGLGTPNGSSAF
jgi:subtilase family serine protease